MKIKKLEWVNTLYDLGNESGLFSIKSDIERLPINYYIKNFKYYGDEPSNKYFLSEASGLSRLSSYEFDTLEEAKEKAQELFENKVMEYFFNL